MRISSLILLVLLTCSCSYKDTQEVKYLKAPTYCKDIQVVDFRVAYGPEVLTIKCNGDQGSQTFFQLINERSFEKDKWYTVLPQSGITVQYKSSCTGQECY